MQPKTVPVNYKIQLNMWKIFSINSQENLFIFNTKMKIIYHKNIPIFAYFNLKINPIFKDY